MVSEPILRQTVLKLADTAVQMAQVPAKYLVGRITACRIQMNPWETERLVITGLTLKE